jgi:hypothetical protein
METLKEEINEILYYHDSEVPQEERDKIVKKIIKAIVAFVESVKDVKK